MLTLRPLRPDDAERLDRYFDGLSPQTRRWFAPHDFTPQAARTLCAAVGADDTLRLVAATEGPEPQIVAYFILQFGVRVADAARFQSYGLPLSGQTDCSLAPSVADAYQGAGLGSAMMRHAIDLARRAGKTRMVLFGGVNIENARAMHFYERSGFRTVATFGARGEKRDMILDLAT